MTTTKNRRDKNRIFKHGMYNSEMKCNQNLSQWYQRSIFGTKIQLDEKLTELTLCLNWQKILNFGVLKKSDIYIFGQSLSFDTLCICWKYVELSCPFLFFYRESSIWQTNFYFIPNLFELPAKFQLPSIKTVDLYSKRTLHLTGYTSSICETEPVVYLIGMPCMPVFLSLICSIPMYRLDTFALAPSALLVLLHHQ